MDLNGLHASANSVKRLAEALSRGSYKRHGDSIRYRFRPRRRLRARRWPLQIEQVAEDMHSQGPPRVSRLIVRQFSPASQDRSRLMSIYLAEEGADIDAGDKLTARSCPSVLKVNAHSMS